MSDEAPPALRPPDWLHDAARSALEEMRLFARTLWAVMLRPSSFARAWALRQERALNPLAFIATCGSLLAVVLQGAQTLGLPVNPSQSFGAQLLQSVGPFLQYAVVGVLAHVALLAARPHRRLLDSVAIGLYSGGPALVGYLAVLIAMSVTWLYFGRPDTHDHGMLAALPLAVARRFLRSLYIVVILFVRSLWLGLSGLYGGRWAICGLATLFALVTLAVILGTLNIHGPLGVQLILTHAPGGGWSFDVMD